MGDCDLWSCGVLKGRLYTLANGRGKYDGETSLSPSKNALHVGQHYCIRVKHAPVIQLLQVQKVCCRLPSAPSRGVLTPTIPFLYVLRPLESQITQVATQWQ